MSEIRQLIPNKEAIRRQQVNITNAAGDIDCKKHLTHKKTRNTIPKNLRYDLENALVGLCDVWFEEIKPYLVRNNIKVHGDAGGDLKRSSASPDCSHTDPGRSNRLRLPYASCVDSSSTRPTASKAPCRKPPLVPSKNPITVEAMIQQHNMKKETVRKPRKRRKCSAKTQPRQIIPRLCRTQSRQQCSEVFYPTRDPVIKIPTRNNTKQKKRQASLDASTQTLISMKDIKKSHKVLANNNSNLSKFARCPATTEIFHSKRNEHLTETPLFKEDLVDIIAEKHDKMLKVLYTSPRKEEHPSVMNLFSPSEGHRKSNGRNRILPWK